MITYIGIEEHAVFRMEVMKQASIGASIKDKDFFICRFYPQALIKATDPVDNTSIETRQSASIGILNLNQIQII